MLDMNNWEIIDNDGVIESGSEEEMRTKFEEMVSHNRNGYSASWSGDLKLIEVHRVWK